MRKALLWGLVWILMVCIACPGIAEVVMFEDDQPPIAEEPAGEGLAAETEPVIITPEEIVAPEGIQPGTEIRVGTANPISGYFATDMWGNNAADMDVRALLHGYETVVWTDDMGMRINQTVIASMTEQTGEGGSHVFEIELIEGLTYCDGTPITAKDYVFSLLLLGAPEMEEIGAALQGYGHIKGYSEYLAGQTKVLSGVRLLSNTKFSIDVLADHMPYFYDLAAISVRPYPIEEIAPGCEVIDDGQGVYLAQSAQAASMDAETLGYTPGVFSAEMLEKTMLDPETGYLFMPKVTSGPYMLESFDLEKNEAKFVINTQFIGDPTGSIPHVERLTYRYIPEEGMEAALDSGEIDLQVRITDSGLIQRIRDRIDAGEPLQTAPYPRTGFAFLAFACEQSPTDSIAVRKALAMSLDKDTLVERTMPGTAMRVYGYYGLGQWMVAYTDEGDEAAGVQPLTMMDLLPALDIEMNVPGALALIEQDGWVLNEQGELYEEGETLRYKNINGELVPLIIRFAVTEGDPIAAEIRALFAETLPQLGVQLEVDELDFTTLLAHYYRQTERTYNMFFLASNFNYIFDPYYDFHTDDIYQGRINTSGLKDESLMEAALTLQRTEPGDLRTYVERWFAFQQRFVEVVPMIPLYSNVYFDVLRDNIQGYDVTGNSGWASAIVQAFIHETEEAPAPEEVAMPETEAEELPAPEELPPVESE